MKLLDSFIKVYFTMPIILKTIMVFYAMNKISINMKPGTKPTSSCQISPEYSEEN